MKRFLVFLLLFGGGLALLRWVEAPSGEAEGAEPAVDRPPPPPPGDVPEAPLGLSIRGRFETTLFDPVTGRAVVRFESVDSRTVGEEDEFFGATARILDPDAAEPTDQAIVRSDSASLRRVGATQRYQPEYENRISIGGVEIDVFSGTPLAPVSCRTESATIDARDATDRVLSSPDAVSISSEELDAQGTGVSFHLDEGVIAFEEQGLIEFRRGAGVLAVLTASGPVRIGRRPGTGRRPITIEASEDAVLEFRGEPSWRLEAQRVRLRGSESSEPGQPLKIGRVDAIGDVAWSRGAEAVFDAGRAVVQFDEDGQPMSARLSELPSARIGRSGASARLPGVAPEETLPIRVSGEGPLDLELAAGQRFSMGGPATVETPDGTLRSLGGVEGWTEGSSASGFSADGGVVLESASATLETARLEWRLEPDAEGRSIQTARAQGGPRIEGTLGDGRAFTVTSPETLGVHAVEDHWRVVDATSVIVSVEDPDGFQARAERVVRFDPRSLELLAEGEVTFTSERGEGSGERLEVEGERRFVLTGTDVKPARFAGPDGTLNARRIEGARGRIRARGEVDATVSASLDPEQAGERYELSCDELDLLRSPRKTLSVGVFQRRLDLDARGSVQAVVTSAGERSEVASDALFVRSTDRFEENGGETEHTATSSLLAASGSVESRLERGGRSLTLRGEHLEVDRDFEGDAEADFAVRASGDLDFEVTAPGLGRPIVGEGERLVLDPERNGYLVPAEGGRVWIRGELPSHETPFHLEADRFDLLGGVRLEALRPRLRLEPRAEESAEGVAARGMDAEGERLVATESSFELQGSVRIDASTASGVPWRLSCGRVNFAGSGAATKRIGALTQLSADGGVDFLLGCRDQPIETIHAARATGDELIGQAVLGELRLIGRPARISSPVFVSEADWIAFDPDLQVVVATGRGRMLPTPVKEEREEGEEAPPPPPSDGTNGHGTNGHEAGGQASGGGEGGDSFPWTLEYLSSKTLIEPDSLVYVLQEPVFHEPRTDTVLRATYAIFWIDRQRWMQIPDELASGELGTDDLRSLADQFRLASGGEGTEARLFGLFEASAFSGLLRELYFEGPVEVLLEGDLLARSDAIYLDVVAGHGWLAKATVNVWGRLVGQDFEKLICKTDWLRHSADGSLQANSATVTACDFDEPHVRIVTGDLRIRPIKRDEYEVSLKDNRVEFYDLFTLPLPPINISTDEKGRPFWESLSFGDSARFGSFVSAGVVRPAGELGGKMNDFLGGNPFDYDASYSVDASWLGSRGVLLDLGLLLESQDDYWLSMHLGGVPDDGRDRGYIRVPREGRDELRLWYRARGRYLIDEDEWLSLAVSAQTDAGTQSEYFEREFERYEEDETFLHWRKAYGSTYWDASLEKRIDNFRSQIEELPSAGVYNGREPLLHVGSVPVLHTGDARVEYLERVEGKALLQSPFGLFSRFPDGLGNRSVARFDADQRLEAPVPVGVAGLRATPFVGTRFTAWDDDVTSSDSPTRFLVETGLRLATTFWRPARMDHLHQLSPYVQVRTDAVHERHGGLPVRFDGVEDAVDGQFVDLGFRGRFDVEPGSTSLLDLDVQGTYADSASGLEDGWQPIAIFGRLSVDPWETPLQLWHDGRFDLRRGDTVFADTRLGVRFNEGLRFEAGHRRGQSRIERLVGGEPVQFGQPYEVATVAGLYRWSEKWEFEASQVLSLRQNDGLDTSLVLRRFGHDLIFEIESSVREGEGASLSFNVEPRFGYRTSRLGYMDY